LTQATCLTMPLTGRTGYDLVGWIGNALRLALLVLGLLSGVYAYASQRAEPESYFDLDIPAADADIAIKMLARQTDRAVIFQSPDLIDITTNPVRGSYSLLESLRLLLAGTDLRFEVAAGGIITVAHSDAEASPGESTMVKDSSKNNNKPGKRRGLWGALIAVFAGTGTTGAVQAQDPTAAPVGIEEVMVTARKRDERLIDVPMSVSVLSGAQMQDLGITGFTNVSEFVPSLRFSENFSLQSRISVRGVGGTQVTSAIPGVGLFVDGVFQPNDSFFSMPFQDVNRIEVLRGPQGTLYGRNTLGGAISIHTNRPSNEFEMDISAELGTEDHYGAHILVSGPIVEDKVLFRLAGGYSETGGFFNQVGTGEERGEEDKSYIRGSLNFNVSDTVTADLIAYSYSQERDPVFHFSADLSDDSFDPNTFGPPGGDVDEVDAWGTALTLTADLPIGTLTSISSFDNSDTVAGVDLLFGAALPFLAIDVTALRDSDSTSQELRLQSSGEGDFNWLFGVFYNKVEEDIGSIVPLFGIDTGYSRESETYSAFFDGTYQISEKWELGAGLRYDDVESEDEQFPTLSPQSFDEWQPQLTLRYYLNDNLSAYARAARGFRPGGFNGDTSAVPVFDAETLWSYEVGLKGEIADGRATIALTGFYVDDWEPQFIVLIPELTGVEYDTFQVGKSRSQGAELELMVVANDWLSFNFSAAITDTEVLNTDVAESQGFAPDIVERGSELPFAPEWNAIFGATIDTDLEWLPGYSFTASANVAVTGPTHYSLNLYETGRDFTQDTYTLVNLNLAVYSERFKFELIGTNLSDETYVTNGEAIPTIQGLITGPGSLPGFYNLGDEAQIIARFTASF